MGCAGSKKDRSETSVTRVRWTDFQEVSITFGEPRLSFHSMDICLDSMDGSLEASRLPPVQVTHERYLQSLEHFLRSVDTDASRKLCQDVKKKQFLHAQMLSNADLKS